MLGYWWKKYLPSWVSAWYHLSKDTEIRWKTLNQTFPHHKQIISPSNTNDANNSFIFTFHYVCYICMCNNCIVLCMPRFTTQQPDIWVSCFTMKPEDWRAFAYQHFPLHLSVRQHFAVMFPGYKLWQQKMELDYPTNTQL